MLNQLVGFHQLHDIEEVATQSKTCPIFRLVFLPAGDTVDPRIDRYHSPPALLELFKVGEG